MADAPSKAGVTGTWLTSPYNVSVDYVGTTGGIVRGTGADWFGPLNPIRPYAPPEVASRQWDFPAGFNLTISPRQYEPIGFPTLRAIADSCDVLRTVIETRKDQIARMDWSLKARDAKTQDAAETRIKTATEFFSRPDGVNNWSDWLRMVLEDLFVIDAPALYMQRTRAGKLFALLPVDGATIVPKIDDWGRTPRPYVDQTGKTVTPVAYQQVLKGIPAIDYSVNDLVYRPRNRRTNRAYGYSPVEQIVTTVNIALRRQLFLLDYYTEGNIPDSIASVPETWNPDQIKQWQSYWDSLFEGNLAARRRMKFVPSGTGKSYIQTKEPELKNEFDEWLTRIVCYAFSVSPQAFVRQMNRASGETQKEIAEEEGLVPVLRWIKSFMDDLLQFEFDAADLEFAWGEDKEIDEAQQATILDGHVSKGLMTINEARAKLGMDPLADPAANQPMIITSTGYVPLGANTIEGKKAMQAAFPAPPPPVAAPAGDEPPHAAGEPPAKGGEVGKRAPIPFRSVGSVPYPRAATRRAAAAAKSLWASALRVQAEQVASRIRATVSKLAKVDPLDEEDVRRLYEEIDSVLADFALDLPAAERDDLESVLAGVAADSAGLGYAQVGVGEVGDDIFEQLNGAALAWAKEHAAELVSQISDTTRDDVRSAIADGIASNLSTDEIADAIAALGAFSPERAVLIAQNEIATANSQGALAGYKQASADGVEVMKEWLVAADDVCDDCQDNADAGPIDLDEDFPSGDDAPPGHPHCRCALSPVVRDAASEEDGTDKMVKRGRFVCA